jgi:hypothetical protein
VKLRVLLLEVVEVLTELLLVLAKLLFLLLVFQVLLVIQLTDLRLIIYFGLLLLVETFNLLFVLVLDLAERLLMHTSHALHLSLQVVVGIPRLLELRLVFVFDASDNLLVASQDVLELIGIAALHDLHLFFKPVVAEVLIIHSGCKPLFQISDSGFGLRRLGVKLVRPFLPLATQLLLKHIVLVLLRIDLLLQLLPQLLQLVFVISLLLLDQVLLTVDRRFEVLL